MWIIELSFTESAERLEARPAHRKALSRLHEEGKVRMAGPLDDDSGAVIVVDVPDREAVEALISGDPYYSTPGVAVTSVRGWSPFLT